MAVVKHSQFVNIVNGQPVINIGALRHAVTIQRQTTSGAYDVSGVAASTWTTLATCNAAIGTSGVKQPTDVIRNDQTVSQLFVEVALYYADATALTPNMRVVSDNGSTFQIQTAENVNEMGYVWVLRCIALGANT